MKIVTLNLPESHVVALEKLVTEYGVFPSRSEAIRVALREFLPGEETRLQALAKFNELESEISTV